MLSGILFDPQSFDKCFDARSGIINTFCHLTPSGEILVPRIDPGHLTSPLPEYTRQRQQNLPHVQLFCVCGRVQLELISTCCFAWQKERERLNADA